MELTKEQLDLIKKLRQEMIERFSHVPDAGIEIEYLGKKFIVYKDVFWPHEDSKPLVQNYVINSGEHVLDLCAGCGVIAVFSAAKGAQRVVALDINPDAVRAAKANAARYGFEKIIDVRLSDMFESVGEDEMFDVITANLPFTNEPATDFAEKTVYDPGLKILNKFFECAKRHLKPSGRAYLTRSNFSPLEEMKRLAAKYGFRLRLIGENAIKSDPRIFYAFELRRELAKGVSVPAKKIIIRKK